jgi:predicted nucleic acid-binding Zn ribbon protein
MEAISSVLYSLFRNKPGHSEWIVACLEGAWRGIVGENLARVCRPCRFKDSMLVIEVDVEWEKALRGCEAVLLARLRSATGDEVRRITFTTGTFAR